MRVYYLKLAQKKRVTEGHAVHGMNDTGYGKAHSELNVFEFAGSNLVRLRFLA